MNILPFNIAWYGIDIACSLKFKINTQEIENKKKRKNKVNRIFYLFSKVIYFLVLILTLKVKTLAIPDHDI